MKLLAKVLAVFMVLGMNAKPSGASEIRVDALGGLTTVATDETADLNLFLDGNPAALSLLPAQTRLDLAGQWAATDSPAASVSSPGLSQQTFTTFPRTQDKVIGYQGLMVFLTPQWALQVSGDLNGPQHKNAFSDLDVQNESDAPLFLRTSYNFGFVALGLEAGDTQSDQTFLPGLFDSGVSVLSGQSGENQGWGKAGLVAHFQEGTDASSPLWQIGLGAQVNLSPDQQDQTLVMAFLSQPSFTLRRLFALHDEDFSGGLFYEIPGQWQGRLSFHADDLKTGLTQSASTPSSQFQDLPSFALSDCQSVTLQAAAKGRLHFSDVDLKLGGSFQTTFVSQKIYLPSEENQQTQIETAFGLGLEAPEDYLVGLQFKSKTLIGDSLSPEAAGADGEADPNVDTYQIALGGEKWLSAEWALRIGVINEIDFERSLPQLQTLNSSVVGGVGLREENLNLDAKLLLGEIFPLNDGAVPITTQAGFAVAGTFFL
jgi:hypothetical protein